ncbi:hypothetical protein [Aureimonas glaciei]|uniref:hypothetical protein n=1 Tax=Aureimonas glaciei TaxID=1776957 RepID=UPI00166E8F70|nr:hypothetical protein [Aureimonas glaciei]
MTVITLAWGISVVLLAVLSWMAAVASSFAAVFLAPIPVLLLVQSVALLGPFRFAERFFAVSDVLYYVLIGAVLGLGVRALPELDRLLQRDAMMTYAQAMAGLDQARAAATAARARRNAADAAKATLDPAAIGACEIRLRLEQADRAGRVADDPARTPDPLLSAPVGCETTLALVEAATVAEWDDRDAAVRLAALEARLERGQKPEVAAADLLSPELAETLLSTYFPAALLCGVMLKVGKTTLAMRKLA